MPEHPHTRADLEITEVEDGLVVFDVAADRVHYLDPVASFLFLYCDGTRTVDELSELTRRAYELAETPTAEVRTAVDTFTTEGLLR